MIKNVEKLDGTTIATLVVDATKEQSAEQFVTGYIENLLENLANDPRQYRAYGPYWWPLKDIIIGMGHTAVGSSVELITNEYFAYDNDAATICAAWAHYAAQFEDGKVYSATHQLPLTDGEVYEYDLTDNEMELVIIGLAS